MKTQGQFLKNYYLDLKKSRPNFSQRSFAKFLNLQPPRLYDFMQDKRIMTLEMAENVAARLKLSDGDKQRFVDLVRSQRARTKPCSEVIKIDPQQFQRLSEWYYFAILALADTVEFNANPEWIAKRLNISNDQASKALRLLVELGLLMQNEAGITLRHMRVEANSDHPTPEMMKLFKQSVSRALDLIDEVPSGDQEFYSITFAGDPNKMNLVRRTIRKQSEKLVAQLESGCRTQVYELNIQLVPLSKILSGEQSDVES